MRLLFVHGRGQGGKNAEELKQTWIDTLRLGYKDADIPFPEPLTVDFPYYGDALDERVRLSNLPLPRTIVPKGDGDADPYEEFLRGALKDMQRSARISDDDVAKEAGDIPATEKGIQNWRLTQALTRLLDRRFGDFSSHTIETFLRDVYLYVTNRVVAKQINAIVAEKLTDEPTVVVGHSLGTVVAYKVLLEQGARVKLRRYVTVGSPLGVQTIASRLGVLKYPPADLLWYNAYDPGDIVALNPLAEPYFKTTPTISNYGGVTNDTDNQHGIIGYLNDKTVARSIAEAMA